MSDIFVPDEEIQRRDVNPFADLTSEFFAEHVGETIAVNDGGELLITGTIAEVHDHLTLLGIEDAHVLCVPDFSQATEADLRELFGE